MPSAENLKKRLSRITRKQLQSKVQEIVTNDQTIIEAKQNEFEHGVAPNGDVIGDYAWSWYEDMKAQMNPKAGGNVDLKLSGSFHQGLFVKGLGNRRFLFDSRDEKAPHLFSRTYLNGVDGSVLRGIDKETFEDLQRKEYADKLVRYIKTLI